jgi:tetratricopeptide (TPR) repeat protein
MTTEAPDTTTSEMPHNGNSPGNSKFFRFWRVGSPFLGIVVLILSANLHVLTCLTSDKVAPGRYRMCTAALNEPLAFGWLRILLRHHQVFAADVLRTPAQVLSLADALIAEGKASDFVRFVRGNALAKLKQPNEALAEFTALNQKYPGHPWYAYAAGMALIDIENYDRAIATAKAFMARKPKSSAGHGILGWATYKQGRTAEAIAHLETAIALRPADAMSHQLLSKVLAAAGETARAQAESDLAKKLRHNPQSLNDG